MFHGNRAHWRRITLASAVLVTLGTASMPSVSAEEQSGTSAVSTQINVQILSTTEVNYQAHVLSATDAINTQPWGTPGFATIAWSADYIGKTVEVTQEKLADNGVTWAYVSINGTAIGWIAKTALSEPVEPDYLEVLNTVDIEYTATVTRNTDAINAAPWGTRGFKILTYSSEYLGKNVTVTQEQTIENGVTWALISLNGTQLGWIARDALTEPDYLEVLETTDIQYTATITRGTDAINTVPWGMRGFKTMFLSSAYLGKTATVTQEKVLENGVTWALITVDGKQLGWIATGALTEPNYVQIVSQTTVEYDATIVRDGDAINSQPWGTRGYQTLANSTDYLNKEVLVTQEKVADNGVTWAFITLDGNQLGWIAKDALKKVVYVEILSTTDVDYPATVTRSGDGINTQPWGTRGYKTIGSSSDYLGKQVTVVQEKVADNGVTWALISIDGSQIGWIAKAALTEPTYVQVVSSKTVSYQATVLRGTDGINTLPWGMKGYKTIGYSYTYLGQRVTVSKEQVTDNGVTRALISINGKELGWIAKDALFNKVVTTTDTFYKATITRGTDGINSLPWGVEGYQTVGYTSSYLGSGVTVSQEKLTADGVRWALVSLNGKVLGWIAKDALTVAELNHTVFLDPGHGGWEAGATYSSVMEKTINLAVSNKVKANLEALGFTVIMSRTTDTYVGLLERSEEANASGAEIFVSIHHNAMPSNATVTGIETYYYQYDSDYPPIINEEMHNDPTRILESAQLASAIQDSLVENTGALDRGVRRNTFAVLRETAIPAVLLELGYMSSPTELAKLTTTSYQTTLAKAITVGIVGYFE
ncbi:GW dipeptide domain-containing protein [Trichococcus collinsii]|uniref:N-acetylmuramoyl-L-alanine amidase n=1 Tax=Trichococcus collinsii TaxID=157076 RepID=A0AB38A145_9LACT|nr:GW dipeptide domain-containing protein [Trichococcus collinsii]SEA57427.1 N-acetylmuramoyl-L-alanine amidase [Trichococcus collinsii]